MESPYLPPPEPAENPPENKSTRSALLTTIVVVLILVAVAVAFGGGGERGGGAWLAAWLPDRVVTLAYYGWPFAVIGAFFLFVWWVSRSYRRINLALEPGITALAEEQHDEAARVFEQLLARRRWPREGTAVARYGLAIALRHAGDLGGSAAQLVQAEKGAGPIGGEGIRLLAAIALAEVYALLGELEAASRWIDESRRRLARAADRRRAAALLRRAEAIVQCRQGRFAEAASDIDRDLRRLEGTLSVHSMRPVWLVRAFAAAQLGGPRDEGTVDGLLAPLTRMPKGAVDVGLRPPARRSAREARLEEAPR